MLTVMASVPVKANAPLLEVLEAAACGTGSWGVVAGGVVTAGAVVGTESVGQGP